MIEKDTISIKSGTMGIILKSVERYRIMTAIRNFTSKWYELSICTDSTTLLHKNIYL